MELLSDVDFEYFELNRVHKFSRGKFVKYVDDMGNPVLDDRQNVPVDNYVKLVGEDWHSLLICFATTPFLLEDQLKKVVSKKLRANTDYIKLENALYSLRSLGVLKKYEYDFHTLDKRKDVAYVLSNCQPLANYFDDVSELKKYWKLKQIPNLARKEFLNWDNAVHFFWNMIEQQVKTRLYNINDRPVVFFDYYGRPFGINFGLGISEHNFVSNLRGIPILNFYFQDYSDEHNPQDDICDWDLEKTMPEWFQNFDLKKWNNDRNTYLKQRKAERDYRCKHKWLSRFHLI